MLIANCWDKIKRPFDSFCCKHCNYKTISLLKMRKHLAKEHNEKFTKADIQLLIRYHPIANVITTILCGILIIPLTLLKIITLPLYYLHEIL